MVLGDNMAASIPVGDIVRLSQLGWQIYEMAWGDSGALSKRGSALQYAAFRSELEALDDSLQLLKTKPEIEDQVSPRSEFQAIGSPWQISRRRT